MDEDMIKTVFGFFPQQLLQSKKVTTQRAHNVEMTSHRCDDVASMPIPRHFDIMCLLGASMAETI